MKKPYFLYITGLFLLTGSLNAQVLVKENKLWSNTYIGCDGPDVYHSYWIKFEDDTLIHDTTYLKIYRSTDEYHEAWSVYGAIMEDTSGKVYMHQGNKRKLLYDFSVDVGDTLKGFNSWMDYYVVNMEFTLLDGFEEPVRKVEICTQKECGSAEGYWLEGIGSMHGILLGVDMIGVVGGEYDLVCMYENDTLKYKNDYFQECFPRGWRQGIETYKNLVTDIIYDRESIVFKFSGSFPGGAAFRIHDITGMQVQEYTIHENSLRIDKARFENGIYVFTCRDGTDLISGKFVISR